MTDLSIARIEAATLTAWPAITTAMDGMWLARFARGYTKRSNSMQCLDPADDGDAAARLQRLTDLYPLNSLDPVFRVTPLAGPGVVAALDADGWGTPFDETRVLEMPLGAVPDVPDGVEVLDGTDRKWVRSFVNLANLDRGPAEIFAIILNLIACRNAGIFIRDARGEPVAAALAVNASGIGVYHNVLVRPDARGKGFGRLAIQAALA
ncbi:MAG: GNAT family N-acetyltransferase, partial [Devosia sp.]